MKSLMNILLFTLFLSGFHNCVTFAQGEAFSFAVITDLHVSPGMKSESDLNKIVDEINGLKTEFVIVTGDLSNSGSDTELNAVKKALDRLQKPCYVLPGNHDTNWSESAGLLVNQLWGNDRFVFDHGRFRLIGFSTGPFMKMGDGHVKGEDIAWLKRQLSAREGRIPIAFSHYPLNEGLDNWPEVTNLLSKAGCKLAFCGHGHSLRLYNFDGIPGIMCRSVILGKSDIAGYNIINVRDDSVFVYNKSTASELQEPSIKLNYMKPENSIAALPVSPLPDFSMNKNFNDRNIVKESIDTASVFSGPCIVNGKLVYANSLGYVRAISIATGEKLWETRLAGPVYSTPVAWKKIVSIGTVDGRILGLDSRNGKAIWEVKTGRPVLAEGAVENGDLFIGGGNNVFYRISMQSGKVLWKFPDVGGLIQGRAAISDSSVVFGAWDKFFYCLDKRTGSLKWKWNNGKPQVLYSPGNIYPVISRGRVFIVAPDRFITALDETSGKQVWRTGRHAVRESMGASPDGSVVYAKLMNDTIIAVSAVKDRPVTEWKVDAGFGYEHNPCPVTASGKEIYAGTRDGVIISIDAVSHRVRWKYKAGNSSVNRIVPGEDGVIWCSLVEGKIVGIKTAYQ